MCHIKGLLQKFRAFGPFTYTENLMCLLFKFVQNVFLTDSVLRNEKEIKQSEVVLMHIGPF